MSSQYLLAAAVNAVDAYTYLYLRQPKYDEIIIGIKAATQNAKITIDGAFDGTNWDVVLQAEATITAAAAMTLYRLTERYPAIRIGYKNAAAGVVAVVTIGYSIKEAPI